MQSLGRTELYNKCRHNSVSGYLQECHAFKQEINHLNSESQSEQWIDGDVQQNGLSECSTNLLCCKYATVIKVGIFLFSSLFDTRDYGSVYQLSSVAKRT